MTTGTTLPSDFLPESWRETKLLVRSKVEVDESVLKSRQELVETKTPAGLGNINGARLAHTARQIALYSCTYCWAAMSPSLDPPSMFLADEMVQQSCKSSWGVEETCQVGTWCLGNSMGSFACFG